jgi:hypothetical protein
VQGGLQGLAPGGVAEAGHDALVAGGPSAGAHGCSAGEERGAGAVQLVAHRSKHGSKRQRRGLGDGGVGLGARRWAEGAQYCSNSREDDARQQQLEGEARAGYLGSRDLMKRVSGRFYMGARARAQREGGVQKNQIGTGVRLVDFYRAKRPDLA